MRFVDTGELRRGASERPPEPLTKPRVNVDAMAVLGRRRPAVAAGGRPHGVYMVTVPVWVRYFAPRVEVPVPKLPNVNSLLTPGEAAQYTRYSARTVRRWRASGWIRPLGFTSRPRYRRDELDVVMLALAHGVRPSVTATNCGSQFEPSPQV